MRKRGYFILAENIAEVFTGPPPWRLGHQRQMKDLPMDLPGDNRFILANSLTRLIFGPFVQTQSEQYHEQGIIYARKMPGVPDTYDVNCHWIMQFVQANESYRITHGLPWLYVAELLDVPEAAWRNFRSLQISEDKFNRLCRELERVNTDQTVRSVAGRNILGDEFDDEPYYDLGQAGEDWSYVSFIRSIYGDDLTDQQIEFIAESDDRD